MKKKQLKIQNGENNIKVEKDKVFLMWTGVTFFMILALMVWMYSFRGSLTELKNDNSGETLLFQEPLEIFNDISEEISELKNEINTMKEAYSTSTPGIAAGNEVTASTSALVDIKLDLLKKKIEDSVSSTSSSTLASTNNKSTTTSSSTSIEFELDN